MQKRKNIRPCVLVILDGYGVAPSGPGNAIELSNPVCMHRLMRDFPSTTLSASGEAVGLPYGEVGNTEVGHLSLGAGRVILQSLPRINTSIADSSFYKNKAFLGAIAHIKKTHGKLHLIGLIGEHHVHASTDHLFALLYFCREHSIENSFLHIITDGRDSPPKAALKLLPQVDELVKSLNVGTISTIMGRYYAMDRDQHWERISKAYECLTEGSGVKANNWYEAINSSYNEGKSDEFIQPTSIIRDGKPIGLVEDGDAVIFFNYRIDRPRELTEAFVIENFPSHDTFNRGQKLKDLYFVTMTDYQRNLPVHIAFTQHPIHDTLGSVLEKNNIQQLRIAESEKERFVTIYFNGLHDKSFKGEDNVIIPSPRVATYDLKPEMSALSITKSVNEAIIEGNYGFIVVNFANADMVGHTGIKKATIEAIKVLDDCIDSITKQALKNKWTVYITGDHGNAEEKINPISKQISTEHTNNPVPFIVVDSLLYKIKKSIQVGTLCDVAPTILAHMGIEKPKSMIGKDLLQKLH